MRSEIRMKLDEKIKRHEERIEYANRLVSLQRVIKGSKLSYEDNPRNVSWKNLFLRDKKGFPIAVVSSYSRYPGIISHRMDFAE